MDEISLSIVQTCSYQKNWNYKSRGYHPNLTGIDLFEICTDMLLLFLKYNTAEIDKRMG